MTVLWRISEFADLSGEGGRIGSARWHTRGRAVVYLTESPAAAMLERIVHMLGFDADEDVSLPRFYQLLRVLVPDDVETKELNVLARVEWRDDVQFTRGVGDAWLASAETAVARVPSAIVPQTWNYLMNPAHRDAKRIEIVEASRERFDNRLFGIGSR